MKNNLPIGIFDSGVGGLTVYKVLKDTFSNEQFIYLGDTARVPYGVKSPETIIQYSIQNANFLINKGIKLLIVACNTSSAYSIPYLVDKLSVPVIGVIKSGAKKACNSTKNKKIGVIGTPSTIESGAYQREIKEILPGAEIHSKPCPLFVPLVEEGWIDNKITKEVAEIYLNEFKNFNIDTLILGCTHYPLLIKTIKDILGENVDLITSGDAIKEDIMLLMEVLNLKNRDKERKEDTFYVTDSIERFKKVGELFLNKEIKSIYHIDFKITFEFSEELKNENRWEK